MDTNPNTRGLDTPCAYSVVIPVYNSSESLRELLGRIESVFKSMEQASLEIIFVDDASPNNATWPTLRELQAENPRVVVIRLLKNAGQHNATLCGLRHARGELVFTMDDDLQHLPEEMPKMIAFMQERLDCDALFARPVEREHAAARNVGSYLVNHLVGLAIDKPEGLTLSSFRLLRRNLVDAICAYTGNVVTISSLVCQATPRIANLDVQHGARAFGQSNYSALKLASLAVANVFNFSDLPLRAISVVGFISSTFALCYGLWILVGWMTGRVIQPGFPSLALLISFYCGLILFSFGILGQYVIRILRGVTGGSQYHLRQRLGWSDEKIAGSGSDPVPSSHRAKSPV